jgi:glutathione S-transferase
MRLIGMLDSPYVRRVAISLQLLGLRFEHQSLSVFRTFSEFQKINPVVKAPTFVCDDGEVLMDSNLIIQYAEALAKPRTLMPSELRQLQADLRLIGLALAATEKSVQIVYERGVRPPEKFHEPWTGTGTGQRVDSPSRGHRRGSLALHTASAPGGRSRAAVPAPDRLLGGSGSAARVRGRTARRWHVPKTRLDAYAKRPGTRLHRLARRRSRGAGSSPRLARSRCRFAAWTRQTGVERGTDALRSQRPSVALSRRCRTPPTSSAAFARRRVPDRRARRRHPRARTASHSAPRRVPIALRRPSRSASGGR